MRESLLSDPLVTAEASLPGMVGCHPLMLEVHRHVRAIASSDDPVMLVGETGTGKELVARALHDLSPRGRNTFLAVNASALPDTLFESELFGHERGAFSDARSEKPGLLEVAHPGTLYFDELGSLSSPSQAKVLRVIEDGRAMRVGGVQNRPAAPRWIASCQAIDPRSQVGRGIREDLWYRLTGAIILLPPLRDRVSDIPLLVAHFLALRGYPTDWFEDAALALLAAARWRGNVRELQRVVGRLLAGHNGNRITAGAVRQELATAADPAAARERFELLVTLETHDWNVSRAARARGIARGTLYRRLQAAGLERPPKVSRVFNERS
jgi:two-component system NtrC family response regulator